MKNKGYIKWFDKSSREGIIKSLDDGKNYYFNNWSCKDTKYLVTGICKKTAKKKTILTRHYPGLFLDYKVIDGKDCLKYLKDQPVTFEILNDPYRWAIKVDISDHHEDVWTDHVTSLIESLISIDDRKSDPSWRQFYEKRLDEYIQEAWNEKK